MAVRRLRIKEGFSSRERLNGGFRGEVIFGLNKRYIPFVDPFGNPGVKAEFETEVAKLPNIVPIGAYQFAFSKLFNIGLDQRSTLRVGDLNDEAPQMKIGVQRQEYQSVFYDAETSLTNSGMIINPGINISAMNFIFGFMIGDGGAKEDNVTAIAPDYKRRNLIHPVPFRMSNDGAPFPEGRYFGRVDNFGSIGSSEPVSSYFVKRFDVQPDGTSAVRIIHSWVTDNNSEIEIVDDSVFATTSSIPIESYVEMELSIDDIDGRGFFTTNQTSPRINEFGLVSGWYNSQKNDYEAIRLFTHFTRPSIALSEGDRVEAIYRLYAR